MNKLEYWRIETVIQLLFTTLTILFEVPFDCNEIAL